MESGYERGGDDEDDEPHCVRTNPDLRARNVKRRKRLTQAYDDRKNCVGLDGSRGVG